MCSRRRSFDCCDCGISNVRIGLDNPKTTGSVVLSADQIVGTLGNILFDENFLVNGTLDPSTGCVTIADISPNAVYTLTLVVFPAANVSSFTFLLNGVPTAPATSDPVTGVAKLAAILGPSTEICVRNSSGVSATAEAGTRLILT